MRCTGILSQDRTALQPPNEEVTLRRRSMCVCSQPPRSPPGTSGSLSLFFPPPTNVVISGTLRTSFTFDDQSGLTCSGTGTTLTASRREPLTSAKCQLRLGLLRSDVDRHLRAQEIRYFFLSARCNLLIRFYSNHKTAGRFVTIE